MSLIPMGGHVIRPSSKLVENAPEYYMSMGHMDEEVANRYGISREEQDPFAVESHRRAAKAIKECKFKDEIVPYEVVQRVVGDKNKIEEKKFIFDTDEGVRPDTTKEVLAKLRPAFSVTVSVIAGNSSQLSEWAACVLLMDRE